jgi:hypothetical protein
LDNLTHTLVGVTLVRAGLGARVPGATLTIALASNLPDTDIVTAAWGQVAYLAAHRGPTHGPLGVVAFGVLAALLAVAWRARRREDRPPGNVGLRTVVRGEHLVARTTGTRPEVARRNYGHAGMNLDRNASAFCDLAQSLETPLRVRRHVVGDVD